MLRQAEQIDKEFLIRLDTGKQQEQQRVGHDRRINSQHRIGKRLYLAVSVKYFTVHMCLLSRPP